jgi:GMP synthase-like glutamine amidotransferase
MRLHLLEHDPDYFTETNIAVWAKKKDYTITKTDVFNQEQFPHQDHFDWLIIMGGSQHIWQEQANQWLISEKKFLDDTLRSGKIVLGICLGAQLLAEAFGGRAFTNKHPEIGWHEVCVNPDGKNSFLFKDIPDAFLTFHWHSDHFSLPAGCTCLAGSEPTVNQAFIHNESPAVGLQFHPEYTRRMVKSYAKQYGHEWVPGRFVFDKSSVLTQTEQIPDTYWLMEKLLDNMDREFAGTLVA